MVPTPAVVAEPLELVVVLAVSAVVHQAVDGSGAAHGLSAHPAFVEFVGGAVRLELVDEAVLVALVSKGVRVFGPLFEQACAHHRDREVRTAGRRARFDH